MKVVESREKKGYTRSVSMWYNYICKVVKIKN